MAALAASNGDAKVLAGGQSLVPMLNFRVVDAPLFVDINGIEGLDRIEEKEDGGLRIGALTRHFALETSVSVRDRFPVLHEAMKHVAHLAIRNRGTIGKDCCRRSGWRAGDPGGGFLYRTADHRAGAG